MLNKQEKTQEETVQQTEPKRLPKHWLTQKEAEELFTETSGLIEIMAIAMDAAQKGIPVDYSAFPNLYKSFDVARAKIETLRINSFNMYNSLSA
jgi:hypothetical protein